jgi:hypothetical protein
MAARITRAVFVFSNVSKTRARTWPSTIGSIYERRAECTFVQIELFVKLLLDGSLVTDSSACVR